MFYFKQTRLEDGRFTFTRALQSLDKRDVAETAVKFAQIEFKYGDAERGKKSTLFIYRYDFCLIFWFFFVPFQYCLQYDRRLLQNREQFFFIKVNVKT
jgi:hypothetical protein